VAQTNFIIELLIYIKIYTVLGYLRFLFVFQGLGSKSPDQIYRRVDTPRFALPLFIVSLSAILVKYQMHSI
jgi:hypothetical protein